MRTAVLSIILAALPAQAAFRLVWLAPDSCADHPPAAELAPTGEGHAEVHLREDGNKWLVTVLFFEPEQGLRRVVTNSCAEAVRAASLLLKLGSHGALPLEEPPPPPSVTVPPSPPPAAPPVAEEAWHFSLAAGGALDLGTFATAEPRIAASASATRGLMRVALDVRAGFARPLADQLTAMRLVELQGAGCLDFTWRSLSAGPCAAASLGTWSVNASWGKSRTVATAALSAQLRVSVILVGGLELSALGGLRFNVARPRVLVSEVAVSSMPLLAGDLQAVIGWRW